MALVHEWLEAIGGSENVFWALADQFPDADRWCLWDNRSDRTPRVRETWLARTPAPRSKMVALPLMPLAWRTQRAESYDVVLSSSHAYAHTVRFRGSRDALYLSYVHAPARYLWTPELDSRGARALVAAGSPLLRAVDRRLGRHVSALAVNSLEVRDRVRRFWDQDATVIHPPVDVEYYADGSAEDEELLPAGLPGTYALAAGRWVPYKGFDAAIRAAALADLPLVLAGGGPDERRLRALAATLGAPVTFVDNPSRALLRLLYRRAQVFVFASHEDFGIMPVEAQAAGTPVAGVAVGGLLETVVPGRTGVLAGSANPTDLAVALRAAAELKGSAEPAENARRFGAGAFRRSIGEWFSAAAGRTG